MQTHELHRGRLIDHVRRVVVAYRPGLHGPAQRSAESVRIQLLK